jgi:hypothetical protein
MCQHQVRPAVHVQQLKLAIEIVIDDRAGIGETGVVDEQPDIQRIEVRP